jgi:hypothetical protein
MSLSYTTHLPPRGELRRGALSNKRSVYHRSPPRTGSLAPNSHTQRRTAMKKLRIVILRFGTARQKRVLERWTNPKPLQPSWDRAAI